MWNFTKNSNHHYKLKPLQLFSRQMVVFPPPHKIESNPSIDTDRIIAAINQLVKLFDFM